MVVIYSGEGGRISACVPAYLVAGIDVCTCSGEQLNHLVGIRAWPVGRFVQGSASFLEAARHELKA